MTKPALHPSARLIRLETEPLALYLLEADVCMIGRSPLCQVLVEQPIVSRLHARVERCGPRYLIADAGSANGTFVNGRPLRQPHLLADGDLIGLGRAAPTLRFET